jgi:16S rRNA A1518/A1519 N6-dimethyltransferase RsmA/KsgA/DIM1 with predicted DNA glycosylase/AP lyase activity
VIEVEIPDTGEKEKLQVQLRYIFSCTRVPNICPHAHHPASTRPSLEVEAKMERTKKRRKRKKSRTKLRKMLKQKRRTKGKSRGSSCVVIESV